MRYLALLMLLLPGVLWGAPTTVNDKLALMEWGIPWEPGLPISPGALGTDDKQQLVWGYPGVTWEEQVYVPPPDTAAGGGIIILLF